MSVDGPAPIAVTLTLADTLPGLQREALGRRLTGRITALAEQLGVPNKAQVTVETRSFPARRIQIGVHGRSLPYDPFFMQQVWGGLAPQALQRLPHTGAEQGSGEGGFPDGWLAEYASRPEADVELLWAFVEELVVQRIARQAGTLVGEGEAETYARAGEGGAELPAAAVHGVLSFLLNFGVGLGERSRILEALTSGLAAGRPWQDVAEGLYAMLRSPAVELHCHPDILAQMWSTQGVGGETTAGARFPVYDGPANGQAWQAFERVEEELFNDRGLLLPELQWVANSDVPNGYVAIKINDILGIPYAVLLEGELFIANRLEDLGWLNVDLQPHSHPVYRWTGATMSSEHEEAVERLSLSIWTPPDYVALVLHAEVHERATRFVDVDTTMHLLAQAADSAPQLAAMALEHYTVEEITRVARQLVEEDVSLQWLGRVLNRMLQFESLPVWEPERIILDDRVETFPGSERPSTDDYVNFVRMGLRYLLSYQMAGSRFELGVIMLDSELEKRLSSGRDAALNEHEAEQLCEALWWAVGSRLERASRQPVQKHNGQPVAVLTAQPARRLLREALADEFPTMPVIAYNELRQDMQLYKLDSVYI